MKKITFSLLFLLFAMANLVQAQASLSIQGVIKNSDGTAVDNGNYSLTFKLYNQATGGTPVWSETQDAVSVTGGIYSALLGDAEPLDAPFNETYYLGVAVDGGAEMVPRAKLTSSPYALALIGNSNVFASDGNVGIGTANPSEKLEVIGNLRVDGNVEFTGNVTGDLGVDLSNLTEDVSTTGNINADGSMTAGSGLNLPAGQSINYNGKSDWRLVETDDFETDTEGWSAYMGAFTSNNTTAADNRNIGVPLQDGKVLVNRTNQGNHLLAKEFDLSGIPHSKIKIRATLHFRGTVDDGECMWIGLSPNAGTAPLAFNRRCYEGMQLQDIREIILDTSTNKFFLAVWGNLNEGVTNEYFAIDDVEIWVK